MARLLPNYSETKQLNDMIKTVALEKIFRTEEVETSALNKVSIEVKEGEFVAIMGPSGCGKSTLLNILGLLDNPTTGEYYLNGIEVSQYTEAQRTKLRKGIIGFVFQSYYLMPKMDAVDNVALPLLYADVPLKERRERAAESLGVVGLEDRIHFLPNQMSGGQCQRVAIARAMVTKPALLLADEPTGALDTKSGAQVMDIFDRLSADGMTILMITHDPDIAKRAKKVYHILDGELLTTPQGGSEHEV